MATSRPFTLLSGLSVVLGELTSSGLQKKRIEDGCLDDGVTLMRGFCVFCTFSFCQALVVL